MSILSDVANLRVPIEFVLFGLTLAGVAIFHHRTLRVSLIGLGVIVLYKLLFTGFESGPGFSGLAASFVHEWVILMNLLALLTGFALLADFFEASKLPAVLPRFLPHNWKGGFLLLALVWVLSSFLDNIAGCHGSEPASTTSSARVMRARSVASISYSVQWMCEGIRSCRRKKRRARRVSIATSMMRFCRGFGRGRRYVRSNECR